jgi:hypothetical protein
MAYDLYMLCRRELFPCHRVVVRSCRRDLCTCRRGFPLHRWGLFGYLLGLWNPLPQQAHDTGVGVQDGHNTSHAVDTT